MNRVDEDAIAGGDSASLLLRLLPIAARLIPVRSREEWLKEWQAELWHLMHFSEPGQPRGAEETLSLAYGIAADAVCLGLQSVQAKVRTSAYACLWILGAYCLFCALVERVAEGSWYAAVEAAGEHFWGLFVFVAIPAVFASIATYPLRPLRSDTQNNRPTGNSASDLASNSTSNLSVRARWNLFLAAKILLTLALGFLVSLVAVGPIHMAVGRYSDWFELALYACSVTGGMRWALLNQEQRCQRCLRMLSQPTRIGPPSRNFLDWSGTELACTDGHGRLQVPEMQGSWCWYDLWLEREPGRDANWAGIFGG